MKLMENIISQDLDRLAVPQKPLD